MSKVICEICGTAYPDTAAECPICGFPRSKVSVDLDELQPTEAELAAPAAAKVRGGRFSNKNVKKRHSEDQSYPQPRSRRQEPDYGDEKPRPGRGMKIFVIVLLVGVLLLGAYIGYRFLRGADAYHNPKAPSVPTETARPSVQTEPGETPEPPVTTLPAETGIPCTDLLVSDTELSLHAAGRGWLLGVSALPEDTTDEITYSSSDESVAEVSDSGRITSVGPGTAVITITCGDITRECTVYCTFEGAQPTTEPEAPTETEATRPSDPNAAKGFRLDRSDVTLFSKGESFQFGLTNDGEKLSPSQVEWKSSDESVAKVENGKVTATGAGKAVITATYNGTSQECIIRCRFEEDSSDNQNQYADSNWKMSDKDGDATLIIGEAFTLKLTNDAGETAKVTWNSSNYGVVSVDGNIITGRVAGVTELTATIDGKTFTCIVRVISHR